MSQRNRPPRGGARTGAHENGEEAGIWAQCQEDLKKFARLETRAAEINLAIQAKELEIKAKEPTSECFLLAHLEQDATEAPIHPTVWHFV